MARLRQIAFLCLISGLLGISAANANIESPEQVIKRVTDQLLSRIRAEGLDKTEDQKRMRSLVREEVFPHFDFVRMSRYILGKESWTGASQEERQRFVDEFANLLLRTYASAMSAVSDRAIEYQPVEEDQDANKAEVKTVVVSADGESLPIDYRLMAGDDDKWKVYDVSIDGISLIRTYRGEYAGILKKSGLIGLTDLLVAKNLDGCDPSLRLVC